MKELETFAILAEMVTVVHPITRVHVFEVSYRGRTYMEPRMRGHSSYRSFRRMLGSTRKVSTVLLYPFLDEVRAESIA